MGLRGQAANERGYAMAALLVSIAVMAVLMTMALPAYRHQAQREKEAELAFRGEQYARAVALYRAKNGNNFPPSIDVLVQGKYLRKKYVDPVSEDGEFRIIPVGNPQGQQGGPGRANTPPQGRGNPSGQGGISGGIMGVASKSTENSIRIYKGQTRYDMWPFTFNVVNRPGGNMPGAQGPGGPGQRGGPGRAGAPGPGGRGPGGRGPGPGGRGPGMGPRGGGPVDERIMMPGRGRRGGGF